jgi:hypothetical protein
VLPPLPPPAAVPGDSLQADSTIVPVSVVALLDSVTLGLPDPSTFKFAPYRLSFAPDYIARPSIGYAPDSYGRTVFGGTTLVLSDMLGNNRVAFSGEINGRFRESRLFLGYTNVGNRLQYSGGLSQAPYYFLSSDSLRPTGSPNAFTEHHEITVYLARQAFAVTAYPFNRFSRLEVGGGFNNVDRRRWFLNRQIENNAATEPFTVDSIRPDPTLNYFDGQIAYVSDNTIFGGLDKSVFPGCIAVVGIGFQIVIQRQGEVVDHNGVKDAVIGMIDDIDLFASRQQTLQLGQILAPGPHIFNFNPGVLRHKSVGRGLQHLLERLAFTKHAEVDDLGVLRLYHGGD